MVDIQSIEKRISDSIAPKLERFAEILETYPDAIPVSVAAEFMGISEQALRNQLHASYNTPGTRWKVGGKSGFNIPTAKFYYWITCRKVQ